MKKFTLRLSDGSLVWTSTMPPFLQVPKVVLWGERVFHLFSENPEGLEYREVFAWSAPHSPMDFRSR